MFLLKPCCSLFTPIPLERGTHMASVRWRNETIPFGIRKTGLEAISGDFEESEPLRSAMSTVNSCDAVLFPVQLAWLQFPPTNLRNSSYILWCLLAQRVEKVLLRRGESVVNRVWLKVKWVISVFFFSGQVIQWATSLSKLIQKNLWFQKKRFVSSCFGHLRMITFDKISVWSKIAFSFDTIGFWSENN